MKKQDQTTQKKPVQMPYAAKLQKLMQNFTGACTAIEALALEHQIHPTHIADLTRFVRGRTAEMQKKVEHRAQDFAMSDVFEDQMDQMDAPALDQSSRRSASAEQDGGNDAAA